MVREEFEKLNIPVDNVELGLATTTSELNTQQIESIRKVLGENGFELIDDKKSQLIHNIKTLIIEKIHHPEESNQSINSSDYIAREIGYDYSYISNLFSSVEGITLEKYIINQESKPKHLMRFLI